MPESGIDSSSYDRTLSFPESWRTRLGRIVLSRPVGVLAGAALLLIFLGCMSLSIGCKPDGDGTICQEGKVCLQGEEERDVYYPVPYASPPNLEISDGGSWYEIIEQKADHFRIRSGGAAHSDRHSAWASDGAAAANERLPGSATCTDTHSNPLKSAVTRNPCTGSAWSIIPITSAAAID
jgi:hypothetical protein